MVRVDRQDENHEILLYSTPRFLSIQEGCELSLPLATLNELIDERLVVECPFDIFRLTSIVGESAVSGRNGLTFAKRGFSSSSSTDVLVESAFSIHRTHVSGSTSFCISMISRSLASLSAPKSGAKT